MFPVARYAASQRRFVDGFLEGYQQAERCVKVAEGELVPEELENSMTPQERADGIEGRLRAHERIKAEFRREIEKAAIKQKVQDEKIKSQKTGSDTSSYEGTKKTRERLLDGLRRAFFRMRASDKKKQNEEVRNSASRDQFSA